MDEKIKRLLQEEAEREADSIMAEVNQDPSLQGVTAPDEIRENLFAQIRAYEAEKAYSNLSEEDKELIRLGKVYKKKKKWNKYIALVAILVLAMAFGVTSMGGPEQVVQKVKWMLAGREQTNIDSASDRVDSVDSVSEAEAYEQIEEEFGFYPVSLEYIPEGMKFQEMIMYDELQCAQLFYMEDEESVIAYMIYPDYRTGSMSNDIEDRLLEEYTKEVKTTLITIKHYYVEENDDERWIAEFEYKDIYYSLQMYNVKEGEVEQIIDNLYLS